MNKNSNRFGRGLMAAAVKHEVSTGIIPTDELREVVGDELRKTATLERAVALMRGPEFQRAIDEIVREHAKSVVVEVLAERDGELEAAVRRIVAERWDEGVRKAAHDILDQHLGTLRKRLGA